MKVCQAMCQYNTGYRQTISEESTGRLTVKTTRAFDSKRLKLAQTSKETKFQTIQDNWDKRDFQRKKKGKKKKA